MPTVASHQTRVYKFRVMTDLPEQAVQELRRGHELGNRLVEIEKAHADRVADLWRAEPELCELEQLVEKAEDAVELMTQRAKRERIKNRSTAIGGDLKEELKAARSELRDLRKQFREKKQERYPLVKDKLTVLSDQRRKAIKD